MELIILIIIALAVGCCARPPLPPAAPFTITIEPQREERGFSGGAFLLFAIALIVLFSLLAV